MLTDLAIREITNGAKRSGSTFFQVPKTTQGFVIFDDAKVEKVTVPVPRSHQLSSSLTISDFVNYAKEQLGSTPVVWVNESGACVIIDDQPDQSTRADRAYLEFATHDEWKKIQSMKDGRNFDQAGLIRALRVDFFDLLTSTDRNDWIGRLKAISVASMVDQGERKMGTRSDTQSAWPECITMRCRVLDDPCLQDAVPQEIRVHVEVSPHGQFTLIANPSDMTKAVRLETQMITDSITESLEGACPVFIGSPE